MGDPGSIQAQAPDRKPTKGEATKEGAKRTAGGVGVGLSVIGLWALETYGGVTVPAEVAGAVAGVVGTIVGWIGARK